MSRPDARQFQSRIEGIDNLPTVSGVLKRLLEVLQNPRISLSEISLFVANDPALTSRLLKMVNSPIYGFPRRISSVKQAVILLGINVVKGLLLGVSVFDLIQKGMVGLWEHSMACAVAARLIGRAKGLKEHEEISTAALLHDLGKVLIALRFREEYEQVIALAREKRLFVGAAEERCFHMSHADVGMLMAQKWNFPKPLTDVIAFHHDPAMAKVAPMETAIVHVADAVVRARGFGFAGDYVMPPPSRAAWDMVAPTEQMLRIIMRETEDSVEEGEEFFA